MRGWQWGDFLYLNAFAFSESRCNALSPRYLLFHLLRCQFGNFFCSYNSIITNQRYLSSKSPAALRSNNCTLVGQPSKKISGIVFHSFPDFSPVLSHLIASYQSIYHITSGLLACIYNFHLVCLLSTVDFSSISNA